MKMDKEEKELFELMLKQIEAQQKLINKLLPFSNQNKLSEENG